MVELDDRARRAAEHWHLTIGEPLTGGTSSAVFAARDSQGRDLVLKLPAAARTDAVALTAAEAAALRAWGGSGAAVALLDATADALLLARAHPGVLWPWSPAGTLDARVAAATELLTRLWIHPPSTSSFPTLAEVYPVDERVAREDAAHEQAERGEPHRGRPGLTRMLPARAAAARLISTTAEVRLLHGDFITKNLVSDSTSPVGSLALDPLPMIGDPAAEAAAFAAYHPAELILPIAEALARSLELDVTRTLRWTAIWAVHQTAQAWRDDQWQLEQLIETLVIDELLRR